MVTAVLISDRQQAGGRRKVSVKISDASNTKTLSLLVAPDWDFETSKPALESSALESWKRQELDDMPNRVLEGLNPEQLLNSATYATPADIVREGIRYGLEVEDVTNVAMMQGIYTYLQANYTPEQLSALTGWTIETINAFNARMAATFQTGNVSAQILAVESLRGEAE